MTDHISTLSLNADQGTPAGDGARYSSMVSWWAAQSVLNPDLVANGDRIILKVYKDFPNPWADSGQVAITGITTGPDNNVIIEPADGQWHDGTYDDGFHITRSNNFSNVIAIDQSYTVVRGIIATAPGNGSQGINVANTAVGCVIDGCIANGGAGGTNANGYGIRIQTGEAPPTVARNCMVNGGRYGIGQTTSSGYYAFENNTVVDTTLVGINCTGVSATNAVVQNNVVYGGSACYSLAATPTVQSNNAASDTTAPGTNSEQSIPSTVFTDYAGGDFSGVQGSVIDDAGADLSGQFTTDILDNSRNGWDMGAWNISGASAISFDGGNPIADIVIGTGATDIDLTDGGTRWTGDLTPFDYEEVGSNLTGSGLSIDAAGSLVGTATAGVFAGVVARGNDTGTNTADSNTFSVTVSVADSITLVEGSPDNNFVYPRKSDGSGDIPRTVNYTGSPTSLEYRAIKGDDANTVVVDWTVFDASPTGGTSALVASVPARTYPMRLEVRLGDNTGVTSTEVATWRVGVRVLVLGGSNASNFSYADPVSGAVAQVQYRPTWESTPGFTYPATEGAGEKATADLFASMFGCSVITTSAGISGSSLLEEGASGADAWENASGSLYSDLLTSVDAMTDGDNIIGMVVYMSAEGDYALSGTNYTGLNIGRGLNALLTNISSDFETVTGDRVPVVLDSVPPGATGTASQLQSIREATVRMANADTNVTLVDTTTLAVSGASTLSAASQATFGKRVAAAIEVSGINLIGVEANETNDALILHFDHGLDDTITDYDDLYLRIESGGVEQSFSDWARTGARQASVTLDTSLTDPTDVVVYLGYGLADSTGANVPLSTDIALSGSGGSIKLPCQVFSGNLYGIA